MVEKLGKNLIAVAIVIAGLIIAGAFLYVNQGKGEKIAGLLTAQQAGEKVINFINQYLVEPGMTVSLVAVAEERGLYKIHFEAEGQEYDSYVTRDGKLLFFQGIDLEKSIETEAPEGQPTTEGEPEAEEKFSEEQLEILAKCLSDKGAKFYGSFGCGWCEHQKEIFGKAAQYLPYIECVDKETQQMTPQCQEAEITGFPTWEFNGKKNTGLKTVRELAELSGCPIRTSF